MSEKGTYSDVKCYACPQQGPWETPRSFAKVSEHLRKPKPYHLMTTDEIYAELTTPRETIEHEVGPRPYHVGNHNEWVGRWSRDRKVGS